LKVDRALIQIKDCSSRALARWQEQSKVASKDKRRGRRCVYVLSILDAVASMAVGQ
jgi:phage terminase Nu1 subunit (DNA packaging protein)